MTAVDNNLFGLEDILTLQYTLSEGDAYYFKSARYLLPLTDNTNLGLYGAWAKLHLGKDFKSFDVFGETEIYSIYMNQTLMKSDFVTLTLNTGYDYKDVFNYQANRDLSKDLMRVAKTGLDLDIADDVGRTIITNAIDVGLPEFMAGLRAKDPRASRDGAGGEFVKYTLNVLRLVNMPFGTTLLLINQLQVTNKPVTATEQFQLGGVNNVRGYPPAELVGDNGFTATAEYAIPPYFIPKNIKVPFTKSKLYDVVRLVAFYDYGNVRLRRPLPTEKKNDQLSSVGWGLRVSLPKSFSLKLDFAWALDRKPSDGDVQHTWIQVATNF
jgi:hemolysin activation/secretion protein